jgi:hypothetical protein
MERISPDPDGQKGLNAGPHDAASRQTSQKKA